MARRTVPHPDVQPFVNRHCGEIRIVMPVIRPDGEPDNLMRAITPRQALIMASELLAGAAAAVKNGGELGQLVASDGA
jgi:hypothetical protein